MLYKTIAVCYNRVCDIARVKFMTWSSERGTWRAVGNMASVERETITGFGGLPPVAPEAEDILKSTYSRNIFPSGAVP